MGGSGTSLWFLSEFPKAVERLSMSILALVYLMGEKSVDVLLCWVVCRMTFAHQGVRYQLSYTAACVKQIHRLLVVTAHCALEEPIFKAKQSTRRGLGKPRPKATKRGFQTHAWG